MHGIASLLARLQCRDTFWIESFNHALLTYLPKRIHFGDLTYQMRMDKDPFYMDRSSLIRIQLEPGLNSD